MTTRLPLFALLTALSALLVLTAGCSKKDADVGPTFVYAGAADPQTLDPAAADDAQSLKVLVNVCEGLVRFKNGTMQIEPCLADTWSLSYDARTCIFALRDNVKFHDGTPLNASAVVWNYQRLTSTNAPGRSAGASRWTAFCNNIESVRALDEQRVEIRLKKPSAAMLADLAAPSAGLVSPLSPAVYGEDLPRHPVGTGPFRFHQWLPNDRIALDVNAEYWGRKPKLGHAVFKTVPDGRARLNLLQTGQAHVADGFSPDELSAARTDRNLKVIETPGLNLAWLAFNCRKPPMNRLELRQAVAMTLQKAPLIEAVYHGEAVAATCLLPPALCGPATKIEEWPHDVARARSLIAQLEVVVKPVTISTNDAFGLKFTYTTNVLEHVELPVLTLHVANAPRPWLPDPMRAAALIKADLEAIGLKIQIVAGDWNAHLAAIRSGECDLALHGKVGSNGDPNEFLNILDPATEQSNPTALLVSPEDSELAAALNNAREQAQPAKRAQARALALALVRERLPIIPLASAKDTIVVRANVRNFLQQPLPLLRLEQVKVK